MCVDKGALVSLFHTSFRIISQPLFVYVMLQKYLNAQVCVDSCVAYPVVSYVLPSFPLEGAV